MELNTTEDNKCCFLHFGRGVQDPLSGDQGGGGSLDPWTPPWIRPSKQRGIRRDDYWLQFNGLFNYTEDTSPTQPQGIGGNYSSEIALKPQLDIHHDYSYIYSFTCTASYLYGWQPLSRSIKALVINHIVSCPSRWHHIYRYSDNHKSFLLSHEFGEQHI